MPPLITPGMLDNGKTLKDFRSNMLSRPKQDMPSIARQMLSAANCLALLREFVQAWKNSTRLRRCKDMATEGVE